jgi:hypothetical protein
MEILPEELDILVQSELRSGEHLVWTGQPLPRRFMRSSIPIVLFGIPWTAFSIFWMAMSLGPLFVAAGQGGFGMFFGCFPLFGLPFVLIGLGMLSSPFWTYRKAKRTCYALTDQRAIVWASGWYSGTAVRSFKPSDLDKMSRIDYSDGSGDLIFEEFLPVSRQSDVHSESTKRGFIAIENVREIEELVRRTLLSAT